MKMGEQSGMLYRLGDINKAEKRRHIHTCDHGLSRCWKIKRITSQKKTRNWPLSKQGNPLETRNGHGLLTDAAAAVSISRRKTFRFYVEILCVMLTYSPDSSDNYFLQLTQTITLAVSSSDYYIAATCVIPLFF